MTDVNPRFGGGFPLPTAAGSRYPELALALANGEPPEPRLGDFREGVVMTRFFSQVILEEVGRNARAGAAGGGGARRGVRTARPAPRRERLLLAGCGSQHEAATPTDHARATTSGAAAAGRRRRPAARHRPTASR